MVDGGDTTGGASKDLGFPGVADSSVGRDGLEVWSRVGVQMAIKVDHRHWTIRFVDAAQQRKGDGVVAPHGDDPRQGLPGLGEAVLISVGERLAHEDAVMAFFDLLDGPGVIVPVGLVMDRRRWGLGDIRGYRNVTAVENLQVADEGVGFQRDVVSAAEGRCVSFAQGKQVVCRTY